MSDSADLTVTKTYIRCPKCGEANSSIDHLADTSGTYTWPCRSCGCRYRFINDHGKVREVVDTGASNRTVYALLVYGNLAIIASDEVRTRRELMDDEELDARTYLYEEHTCPTNYIRQTVAVIDLQTGSTDPHGVFRLAAFGRLKTVLDATNLSYDCRQGLYEEILRLYPPKPAGLAEGMESN